MQYLNISVINFEFSPSDKPVGYNIVWIVGDNFAARTYRKGFKKGCRENTYLKKNYEIKPFINSRYSSSNRNILSRIINSFTDALNKHNKLPKLILFVLDDDLAEEMDYCGSGEATLIRKWFEYIVQKIDKATQDRKGKLPTKGKREDYSKIFWVAPALHLKFTNQQSRGVLTACMLSVIKQFNYMRLIKLKEIWERNDANLVEQSEALTEFGMIQYWKSVSASMEFNLMKRKQKQKTCSSFQSGKGTRGIVHRQRKQTTGTNSMAYSRLVPLE